MLFASEWLGRYVELPADDQELAALLTRCGMVVEDSRRRAKGLVFDLDIPTNRVDAMNHFGVAREIATARRVPLRPPAAEAPESSPPAAELTSVTIDDLDGCPRYAARLIRDVAIARSPAWLADLLEAIGMRPLNNVADITNFVLWELGHPLHAFDFDRLEGGRIVVRRAAAGETLVTLDDVERRLDPADVVIADAARPVALGGIMGGADSAISDASVNVLLEGAWFDPAAIRATAQRFNMHTDASHRFERGASPDGMLAALDRAAALVVELAGGELAAGTIDVAGELPAAATTTLRRRRLEGLLGIEVANDDVEEILGRLGFRVTGDDDGWQVEVPTYRPDVSREEDLIEEVGRHVGYDRLPATLPEVRKIGEPATLEVLGERRLKGSLVAAGCQEAMSSSLSSAAAEAVFADDEKALVRLGNPISEALAVLRAHLAPGLLTSVAHNVHRGQSSLRLFEVGRRFAGPLTDDGVRERWALGIALTGGRRPSHWDEGAPAVDFYDLKGIIEHVTEQMAWPAWRWDQGTAHGLDDGAALLSNDAGGSGWAGKLSADAARHFDVEVDVWLAELDIEELLALPHPTARFEPVSRYPGGVRDVALLVPEAATYRSLEGAARDAAGSASLPLAGISIVEVYAGEEIPAGHRGVTLRFTFRADDRTLTADEIDAGQSALIDALAAAVDARPR